MSVSGQAEGVESDIKSHERAAASLMPSSKSTLQRLDLDVLEPHFSFPRGESEGAFAKSGIGRVVGRRPAPWLRPLIDLLAIDVAGEFVAFHGGA